MDENQLSLMWSVFFGLGLAGDAVMGVVKDVLDVLPVLINTMYHACRAYFFVLYVVMYQIFFLNATHQVKAIAIGIFRANPLV